MVDTENSTYCYLQYKQAIFDLVTKLQFTNLKARESLIPVLVADSNDILFFHWKDRSGAKQDKKEILLRCLREELFGHILKSKFSTKVSIIIARNCSRSSRKVSFRFRFGEVKSIAIVLKQNTSKGEVKRGARGQSQDYTIKTHYQSISKGNIGIWLLAEWILR